ncbi:MAG: hypothetical protein U9Q06_04265 [Nanoarchaeota archaeon]|nr:hypothetical protein [Nanoarchaeota archaeon]
MGEGLVETVRAFDDVYRRLFSDEERPERYQTLKSWIIDDGKGGIPSEIRAMDELIVLLKERNPERIREYLASGKYNTMCCGFYNMPVEGSHFALHNETIPDHFGKILRLPNYKASSMPFYFVDQEEVTTPFFEQLQDEGSGILQRCHDVKREILTSDERFKNHSRDRDIQTAYLLGEADRLEVVQGIANDMKRVYGVVTQIIDGVTRS